MPIRKPIYLLMIAALAVPMPASAVVRPFAKPSAANVQKNQQKQARAREKAALAKDLSAAKARVRGGRGFFQQQWKDMRQATREMTRSKGRLDAAVARYDAAALAHAADPTPQKKALMESANTARNVVGREFRALAGNADRARGSFENTKAQREAAVAQLVAARDAVKRGPPRVAAPAYAAAAALAPTAQPASYSVVQQPSLAAVVSPFTRRMRSTSNAADNGPLPNPLVSAAPNSSPAVSSRSTVYDLSFRQSESSVRSSASFRGLEPDSARLGQ
jgi:hypothetical protein